MKYAGIIPNDTAAAPGIGYTFFTQGCPHKCKGCHNPETWDFNGGLNFTEKTMNKILSDINKNGINRKLCIMGGEPLCKENIPLVRYIIEQVLEKYPEKLEDIYIWSGYTFDELLSMSADNSDLLYILTHCGYIIDGKYEEDKRDTSLYLRGSSNQNIIYMGDKDARKFRQNKTI